VPAPPSPPSPGVSGLALKPLYAPQYDLSRDGDIDVARPAGGGAVEVVLLGHLVINFGRVPAYAHPAATRVNDDCVVHVQCHNCCAANSR
jgi:hypothetical protein